MSHAFELLQGMEAEASLDSALSIAFHNEKYHDFTMKGNDGVKVTAVRIALSLRSKYFETMFMGGFSESNRNTITADYPGVVLKAVVEYIHTDTATILETSAKVKRNNGGVSESQTADFKTLISLTEAAAYYNLPTLCYKVHRFMKVYLDHFPSLSIVLVEDASQEGPVISEDLLETSLAKINNMAMLTEDVLGSLSYSALYLILEKTKSRLLSRKRFEMICKWARANPDQQASAKDMIRDHVELQWVDPDVLSSDIAPVGLVTKDQLLDAFQYQAKRAKHDYKMKFYNPIAKPEWTRAKSNIFGNWSHRWKSDWLNIPPIEFGNKCRWTIRMENARVESARIWLGVAKPTTIALATTYEELKEDGWGFYGDYADVRVRFEENASNQDTSITLTLDLTDEASNNGSLSVSEDGNPNFAAVSNMRNHGEGIDGFLPAVACRNTKFTIESIEFL